MIRSTERITTPLSRWGKLIEGHIESGQPNEALVAIRVVLKHLPRHLCTYQRLLRVLWMQKRWGEGKEWAARLLRADPANTLAWQTFAIVAEEREQRALARSMWQRAFDMEPYSPEIRMGLSRTTIVAANPLELSEAALASLAIKTRQWRRAAKLYTNLAKSNQQRTDFRLRQVVALWQGGAPRQARMLARQLVEANHHLVIGWAVLNAVGDRNDISLALNPLQQMDPEGQYAREWMHVDLPHAPIHLVVTERDEQLLERLG